MYELTVKGHFDAAHSLPSYPGECAKMHGHTWDVEVTVAGEDLDDIDILYDFKRLKEDLAEELAPFDHIVLDEVPPFDTIPPTAENLARILFERLRGRVDACVHVAEVAVWESPIARVSYRLGRPRL